jgi:hypothetical protein
MRKKAQESQKINISDNFINIIDLILRMNNPLENIDYREDFIEKNTKKLIEMKLT